MLQYIYEHKVDSLRNINLPELSSENIIEINKTKPNSSFQKTL